MKWANQESQQQNHTREQNIVSPYLIHALSSMCAIYIKCKEKV